jgi:hypothetical protein
MHLYTWLLIAHAAYFASCFYSVQQANRHLVQDAVDLLTSTYHTTTHHLLDIVGNVDSAQECYQYSVPDNAVSYSDRLFREMIGAETWRFYEQTKRAVQCLLHRDQYRDSILRQVLKRQIYNRTAASMDVVPVVEPSTQLIAVRYDLLEQVMCMELDGVLETDEPEEALHTYFADVLGDAERMLRMAFPDNPAMIETYRVETMADRVKNVLHISPKSFGLWNYALFFGAAIEFSHTYLFRASSHTPVRDIVEELSRYIRAYSQTIHMNTLHTKQYLDELVVAIGRIYAKMRVAYERTMWVGVKGTVLMMQGLHYVRFGMHDFYRLENRVGQS